MGLYDNPNQFSTFQPTGYYPPTGYNPGFSYNRPPQYQAPNAANLGFTVDMVDSQTAAQNYPVSPNETKILFDRNNDVFYKKYANSGGQVTIDIFDFTKRPMQEHAGEDVAKTVKELSERLKTIEDKLAKEV